MPDQVRVGLDVGNCHINMVKLSREPEGLRLLDFASVGVSPSEGKTEKKISQLEQIAREKGLVAVPVNIGVSGESVIVRHINLPKMKKEEVGQALKFEAQQYIPFKMEEVILDYHVLGPLEPDKNKIKVLLVAAKKEVILDFIQLIQQAGLKPNLIDVNSFCLINCFQINGPKITEKDIFGLINLKLDLVNINILQGGNPLFIRDITLIEALPSLLQEKNQPEHFFETLKPLLANLIREIRLSIDYFESEFEQEVSTIYLSGEGAKVAHLPVFFRDQLGREIRLWNPVQNLLVDAAQVNAAVLKESSCMLALACGLALRKPA